MAKGTFERVKPWVGVVQGCLERLRGFMRGFCADFARALLRAAQTAGGHREPEAPAYRWRRGPVFADWRAYVRWIAACKGYA